MKKKSTSQSAFLNLRVLFALCVMLTGVFLALVSLGTFSRVFAQGTTREEMALSLAQALSFQPPACVPGAEMFSDVPASSGFCPYIEELARRGITGGCGGGNFCPGDPVSRQQMAVFIVKALPPLQFTNLTLQNGWFGGSFSTRTPAFAVDAQRVVHFRGAMSAPTGSVLNPFQVPEAIRPDKDVYIVVDMCDAHQGRMLIQPSGQVFVSNVDGALFPTCFTSLEGASYALP
jgi:hypothetical protein